MVFVPKTWENSPSTNTPINATELNRIEAGIVEGTRAATETVTGNVELASAAEMVTGTDLTRVPSVKRVVDYVASVLSGTVTPPPSTGTSVIPPVLFASTNIGMIPLTLKRFVGQTARLLSITDENDTVIAYIDQDGQVGAGGTFTGTGMLRALCRAANIPGLKIQMAALQSGNAIVVQDSTQVNKMTVAPDGTVNGLNVGTIPGTTVKYSPVLVLDAAAAVPTTTPAGTVILRRPA